MGWQIASPFFYVGLAYSATEEVASSETTEEPSSAALLSSEVLESVVPASDTTEEVPAVEEVPLVELLLSPPQAAKLRASIKTITEAIIFFIFSFPFDNKNCSRYPFPKG